MYNEDNRYFVLILIREKTLCSLKTALLISAIR